MALPNSDYKTWSELVEYARERAKISAARNGHQEFDYWLGIMQWAKFADDMDYDPHTELRDGIRTIDEVSTRLKSLRHAQCVHLRKMLMNRGEKVPRLSLDWLRREAEKLL